MRINWRVRFKNGKWVAMFLGAVVTTGYMICDTLGIKIPIPQTDVTKIITAILGLLSMIGVITDPTTKGIGDSDLAMTYKKPRDEIGGEHTPGFTAISQEEHDPSDAPTDKEV